MFALKERCPQTSATQVDSLDGADPGLHDFAGLFVGPAKVGRHRVAHLEGQVWPPDSGGAEHVFLQGTFSEIKGDNFLPSRYCTYVLINCPACCSFQIPACLLFLDGLEEHFSKPNTKQHSRRKTHILT